MPVTEGSLQPRSTGMDGLESGSVKEECDIVLCLPLTDDEEEPKETGCPSNKIALKKSSMVNGFTSSTNGFADGNGEDEERSMEAGTIEQATSNGAVHKDKNFASRFRADNFLNTPLPSQAEPAVGATEVDAERPSEEEDAVTSSGQAEKSAGSGVTIDLDEGVAAEAVGGNGLEPQRAERSASVEKSDGVGEESRAHDSGSGGEGGAVKRGHDATSEQHRQSKKPRKDSPAATAPAPAVPTVDDIIDVDELSNNCSDELLKLFESYKRGSFEGMTIRGLQEVIKQYFCDYMVNRSPLGELRLKCTELLEDHNKLVRTFMSMKKQLQDAKHIIRKLIEEREEANGVDALLPLKVTRSVGLQVCTAGSFLIQPRAEFRAMQRRSSGGDGGTKAEQPRSFGGLRTPEAQESVRNSKAGVAYNSEKSVKSGPNRLTSSAGATTPLPGGKLLIAPSEVVGPGSGGGGGTGGEATKVQHYLIATPVKATSTQGGKTGVVTSTPKETAAQASKGTTQTTPTPLTVTAPQISSSSATQGMEVIDLTDKEERQSSGGSVGDVSSTTGPLPRGSLPNTNSTPLQRTLPKPLQHGATMTPSSDSGSTGGEVPPLQDTSPSTTLGDRLAIEKSNDVQASLIRSFVKLPPLPCAPKYGSNPLPPKPFLRIGRSNGGIMLSWNFGSLKVPTKVALFELFAYQEKVDGSVPKVWNKVGEVTALPLPMACTLTQFVEGHKYHFAVRAVDVHNRKGEFSTPGSILLSIGSDNTDM